MSREPSRETDEGADAASFEDILARLQQVVEQLEQGDLPLEASVATFEKGVRLSRLGLRRLDEAERRIEVLLSTEEAAEGALKTGPLEDDWEA